MTEITTIDVRVNGEPRVVPAGTTVLALVESLALDPSRLAIELDLAILKRELWPSTMLRDGARLEIVQFVGGG
jgi:thiamine biosynthesis protein ThiS